LKQILPLLLLLALVIGVGWWIRRESAYNRFVRDLKIQDIQYVEYQPHVNSAFVKVVSSANVQQVISWLGEARPIDNRYMTTSAADCEMRIIKHDGSIIRLQIGATGPTRSGGQLVASQTYVPIVSGQWKRGAWSGTMSNVYMQLPPSAQLSWDAVPQSPPQVVPGVTTTINPVAVNAPVAVGPEVDWHSAEYFLGQSKLGQAKRVLAKTLAADPNDATAQQLMNDVAGRIQVRLPVLLKELERDLPANVTTLSRQKYLELREKVLEATLMAEMRNEKVFEFAMRLAKARPEVNPRDFREILRLEAIVEIRYPIQDFAWSPDGATIVTCGDDGRVRVWDVSSGREMYSFPATKGKTIKFSEDGTRVWVWNDQQRTWWDVSTGKGSGAVTVADEQKKQSYQVDAVGETVMVFMNGQVVTDLLGHSAEVRTAKISPDGDLAATLGEDKVLSIWGEGSTGRITQLSPFERFRRVQSLHGAGVFSEDGSIISLQLGNPDDVGVAPLKVKKFLVQAPVQRMVSAPGIERVLAELEDGALLVVEPATMKTFPIPKPQGSVGRAGIGPDGKQVAVGNSDGTVRIIDVETGTEAAKLTTTPSRAVKWLEAEISADGAWVMACGEGVVAVWKASTGEQLLLTTQAHAPGIPARIGPAGQELAIIYQDGNLRKLLGLSQSSAQMLGNRFERGITFSRDGQRIAAIQKDDVVYISDLGRRWRNFTTNLKVRPGDEDGLCFSPDGQVLAVKAQDVSVRLIDVASGRELRRLEPADAVGGWLDLPISFSLDGKYLIAGRVVWGVE
jgi:WD40 repeat protein